MRLVNKRSMAADAGDRQPQPELDIGQHETADEHMNDKDLDAELKKDSFLYRKAAKMTVRILLFVFALGSFLFGKVSFASLAHDIKNLTDLEEGRCLKAEAYWRMYWVVTIPYALCLVRCIWQGLGKPRIRFPWPDKCQLFKLLVYAFLESSFVCIFAFYIASQIENSALVVVLQSGVFTGTILYQLWKGCQCKEPDDLQLQTSGSSSYRASDDSDTTTIWPCFRRTRTVTRGWNILALICQLVPLGVLLFVVYKYEISPSEVVDAAPVGLCPVVLLGLSFLWCSAVQQWFLSRPGKPNEQAESVTEDTRTRKINVNINVNRRWKVGIVTGLLRIVFTTGFMLLIAKVDVLGASVSWHCAWNGLRFMESNNAFLINLFVSLGSYLLAWISCTTKMQRGTLVGPMAVSTIGAAVLLFVSCVWPGLQHVFERIGFNTTCANSNIETSLVLVMSFFLLMSQIVCSFAYVLKEKIVPLAKEENLFIQPFYSSPFNEQFLALNRKTVLDSAQRKLAHHKRTNAKVYICTTMYQESSSEQRDLLRSLKGVAEAAANTRDFRRYEAHIFFDGGASGSDVNRFALQLLSLLEEEIDRELARHLRKFQTPYGIQFQLSLPNDVPLFVHLKDSNKVKRKKRWSQVMYMSYVSHLNTNVSSSDVASANETVSGNEDGLPVESENVFILTTDADVIFKYESVEQLIDVLQRDRQVGAACGRTHPVGSGPIAWYQIFDYAIGHWFQKAAEHVLGSVMCCPGCFSMFRVEALKTVLATYRSDVEEASQFLKKDMGEDRWLCTILVEAGWRLEYCAAADNETHCPTSADEFFKQRRRWIPSTMVNLGQLCSNGAKIVRNNDSISRLFILYQAVLLFSSLISPSTVILIVSAGLAAAYDTTEIPIVITMLIITVGYGVLCLLSRQKVQLLIAKLLTFAFAILMGSVVVGILAQSVRSFSRLDSNAATPPTENSSTAVPQTATFSIADLPISTWYAIALAAIYLGASLLHPFEFHCVLHSLWYLLCLPCGFVLLIIYAICNLDDQNWGTRETSKNEEDKTAWNRFVGAVGKTLKRMFWCCSTEEVQKPPDNNSQTAATSSQEGAGEQHTREEITDSVSLPASCRDDARGMPGLDIRTFLKTNCRIEDETVIDKFRNAGYKNTTFLINMTAEEVQGLGVTGTGNIERLLWKIKSQLPDPSLLIPRNVWDNVSDFLETLGIKEDYESLFTSEGYTAGEDLVHLRRLSKEKLRELGITKEGHLKKLCLGIEQLQYATEEDSRICQALRLVHETRMLELQQEKCEEFQFWKLALELWLRPEISEYQKEKEKKLKSDLQSLRNEIVLIFLVTNILWIVLIETLANHSELKLADTNALGLFFLIVYGSVTAIQFLTIIWHRMITFAHWLARSPNSYLPASLQEPTANRGRRQRGPVLVNRGPRRGAEGRGQYRPLSESV